MTDRGGGPVTGTVTKVELAERLTDWVLCGFARWLGEEHRNENRR